MKPHINTLNLLLKKQVETLEKYIVTAMEGIIKSKIEVIASEPIKREAEGLLVELKTFKIKNVFQRIHKHQRKTLEFTSSLKLT